MNKDIINLLSNGIQETFEEDREKILSFIKETFTLNVLKKYLHKNITYFTTSHLSDIQAFMNNGSHDDYYSKSYEKLMDINKQEIDKLSNDRVRYLITMIDCIKNDELYHMNIYNIKQRDRCKGFVFNLDRKLVIF